MQSVTATINKYRDYGWSINMTNQPRGFTLIEMLVVVGIIAIIAAILFPVFARAREKARASACISNYHQIGLAVHMYAQDWDDHTPPNGGSFEGLIQDCEPYTRSSAIFSCPDDYDRDEEGRPGSYRMASLYQGLSLTCGWRDPYDTSVSAQPATTTLAYEAEQDFSQSPVVATYRHSNGTQILLFDAHVKWVKQVK
jgi:prepilin-type N-terminal cleavage/methylation domain-containing protein/prepilin-type processing-associated H-X9-DG protein